jgi:hypothetical protein
MTESGDNWGYAGTGVRLSGTGNGGNERQPLPQSNPWFCATCAIRTTLRYLTIKSVRCFILAHAPDRRLE